MSRGKNLQEMETGTTQSKTAVNAHADAGMAPQKSATSVVAPGQTGAWEDLGGPTPENYRTDDDSAKLKTPGATLKQVKDVVNAKAAAAQAPATSATSVATPGQSGVKEESETEDEDFISEEEIVEASEKEEEGDEADQKEDKKEYGKKKPSKSEEDDKKKEDEDECGMKEEYDIEEDVNALLGGEDLSEEFREKAKVVFEAALHSKVQEIRNSLEEQYSVALSEEVEEIKLELTERVDSYLEYVSSEWLEENALSVERGLKTEITESFLVNLKGLFEEHYVSMPEEKYDVLESMVEKLDDMETKLNEQIQKNVVLNKKLSESVAETVFNDVSEGLAVSQKDKLATLAESVEFGSEEEYHQKLVTLRESYFPRNSGGAVNETENLTEEANFNETTSSSMNAYLRALSNVTKK
jgi:hypothetical protein